MIHIDLSGIMHGSVVLSVPVVSAPPLYKSTFQAGTSSIWWRRLVFILETIVSVAPPGD